MQSLVRPELPTAALRSSQATHAAVDNSAPFATRPESTYKSGKVVQTSGATSAQGVIKAVLKVLADCYETARAFACAIHKPSVSAPDLLEVAFEDLCSRFDLFLQRRRAAGDRQRGLIILDESSHETSLQQMARNFRLLGTKWGGIHNLADTLLFVDSKASRVVQLADHVAYAVFRRYNASDTQYFDVISGKFDTQDGVMHGLRHLQRQNTNCMCPACMSRRLAGLH